MDKLKTQVRALKFLREFTHVATHEIAEKSQNLCVSIISETEKGLRDPSENFITEYAKALQEVIGVKKDLVDVVKKCAEDSELLSLMDEYDQNRKVFITTYRIAKRIMMID